LEYDEIIIKEPKNLKNMEELKLNERTSSINKRMIEVLKELKEEKDESFD
jgi:hypothetical protein